ncbi:MAG: dihydrofolate reductase [Gemmataceae bacterium]
MNHSAPLHVSLVVAMSREGMIGNEQGMPWHLPADLKQFKEVTMGKPMIMGRKTHEIIGRVLPGRANIVLTRQPGYQRPGIRVARSPEEALIQAAALAKEVMIIGGSEIYRLFVSQATHLHLTIVEGSFTGTARFPVEDLNTSRWTVRRQVAHPADARNAYPHTYYLLQRDAAGSEWTALLAGCVS